MPLKKLETNKNHPLPLGKKGKFAFSLFAVTLLAGTVTVTAFATAGGDPLAVVSNLSDFCLFPHPGGGTHPAGLGRGASGPFLSEPRPLPALPGLSHTGGRLVITFAKEILDLITGGA